MIKFLEIQNISRKITNRGARKIIHFFPSMINKKLIACESGLELDLLPLLELDNASIRSYRSQPHRLFYKENNKTRSYTPDFLVDHYGTETIIEVKPEEKLPRHLNKLQNVSVAYAQVDKRFVVLTDKFIQKQPRLDNAKLILRHSRQQVTRTSLKAVVDLFRSHSGPHTINSAVDMLSTQDVQAAEIFKLMYFGIIKFDPEKPLGQDSVIWLNNDVDA